MADVENVLETPVEEAPVKKTRKPRAKKTEAVAAPKAAETTAETQSAPEAAKAPAKRTSKKEAAAKAKKEAVAKEEKAPAKKEAAVKAEKAPAKRTTSKKVNAKQANVYIQFAGREIAAKDILEAAKNAFAQANEGVAIETIELYVKPEEGAAYYVVNGVGGDDKKIEL